jgi:hypothetical protein
MQIALQMIVKQVVRPRFDGSGYPRHRIGLGYISA